MRRWWTDLALGTRLVVVGGPQGWLRAGLTAVGIGLGVALLLLAASVPEALSARDARTMAIQPGPSVAEPGDDTLLLREYGTTFRTSEIRGLRLLPEGPHAPVPPGLTELPGPGELVASPALARLLDSADGELLRPRLDHPIVGVIGDDGLRGPNELAFYLGDDTLAGDGSVSRVDRFGGHVDPPDPLTPLLLLLLVIGVVALLVPMASFVAVATRFGGEQRDRRLAALRLVGAERSALGRIAAGEMLAAAALGVAIGIVGFLGGRAFAGWFTVGGLDVFAADVRPDPLLAGLVVGLVPVLAVGMALLSMRGVVAEPLGVFRQAGAVRRRLVWRLALPVAGVLVLLMMAGDALSRDRDLAVYQVAAGAVLVLAGVAALLPWLVDGVVRRLRGGPVAWQLAVRRLQLGGGSTGRVVNGVAVAAAGAIALQLVFATAWGDSVIVADEPHIDGVPVLVTAFHHAASADESAGRLAEPAGVRSATGLLVVAASAESGPVRSVAVADCAVLRAVSTVQDCADGEAFVVDGAVAAGEVLRFPEGTSGASLGSWTVPDPVRSVALVDRHPFHVFAQVLATPGAGIPDVPGMLHVEVTLDPGDPDAIEHVRNIAAGLDRDVDVSQWHAVQVDETFDVLQRGLLAGVTITLLLVGMSLLVGIVEQLRERRRQLAVLVAFGVRRRSMAWSVLWQTALPVLLGLALAIVAGILLGWLLLAVVSQEIAVDLAQVLSIVGIAAAVVLLATAAAMPVLWRLMRPAGLRAE